MCYRGQTNTLPVAFPSSELPTWPEIRAAFADAYRQSFGRLLDGVEPVLVNARTTCLGGGGLSSVSSLVRLPDGPVPPARATRVFFAGRWLEAALYDRLALPAGAVIAGPALLVQPDSTTFVEPRFAARVHPTGHILIEAER